MGTYCFGDVRIGTAAREQRVSRVLAVGSDVVTLAEARANAKANPVAQRSLVADLTDVTFL